MIYFEYLATRTGEREKGRWKGNGKGKQEGKYFPNGELFYWKGAERKTNLSDLGDNIKNW